jgi:asparagine synthase (glutamine-hydrolysing)
MFLIYHAPRAPDTLETVAHAAARACDTLYPRPTRQRLSGESYVGWTTRLGAAACAQARSPSGMHLIVAGTWFAPRSNIDSIESLGVHIERDGIETVALELEGPYALVVVDERRGTVQVVTDVAGTFHVFVSTHSAGFAIATSSAWLGALTRASLDPVGVREFLATGVVYEDRTLWTGVRKIGQGRIVTFSRDGTVAESYWAFANLTPERDDFATSMVRVVDAMSTAARSIGARFPRVLCDITGGYDSRATIAAFLIAGVPFHGTVSGADDSRDVVVSKAIADGFGIPHSHAVPVLRGDRAEIEESAALTDGEYDALEYARVAATHREHASAYDVSVNGSFGELARGYWWELVWPSIGAKEPLDSAMLSRRRFAATPYDTGLFTDARFDLAVHLQQVIDRANAPLRGMPNTTLLDHAYFALRMHRWQGRIASSTARMWPNVSLFAFRSVLEPVLEARAESRIRSRLIRSLLARYLPKLADYPLDTGYPSAPATIRNLHRFWPIVPYYAQRVRARLSRSMPASPMGMAAASNDATRISTPALDLLSATGLFSIDRLRYWANDAPVSAQYGRLLTLSITLEKVAGMTREGTVLAIERGNPSDAAASALR